MPRSYRRYKEEVGAYLKKNFKESARILDVGAGCGTYFDLLGDYFKNIDGVEVFKPNIERYELENKYRNVYNKDICEMEYEYYDIVIFGDVLEHIEVEEAQRVLRYAIDRSKEVVVAVPYQYEQGEVEGNIYEIHKQDDLTEEIMYIRYPELELLIGDKEYGYYVKKKGNKLT